MLRWAEHLRTRDKFGSPATWAALTELPTFPDGSVGSYALGLMIGSYRGVRIIHHAGNVSGGSSQLLTVPDHGLEIVILANGAPGCKPIELAEQALDLVLAEHLGERIPAIATSDYKDLLGDWWSADTGMIYSLIDEEEVLKLSLPGLVAGLPLERGPGGRVISPEMSIGGIEIGLDEAAQGNGLTLRFGGQSAVYRRVSQDTADVEAFAVAAVGQYYSADADCTAVIVRGGERLVLHCGDSYGQFESELICLGETVARALHPVLGVGSVLSFSKQDGRMTGFRLNSVRTRNLRFERKQDN